MYHDRNLTRCFLIICLLFSTGVAGLFEVSEIIFWGIPLSDYAILLGFIYCLFSSRWRQDHTPVLQPVLWIIALTTMVILSMPLRGNETLLQAFQTGRDFYILLFAYIVIDNVRDEGDFGFIKKLILGFGSYYAILVIINYISPGFTVSIWKGIGAVSDFKGTVERHVLKANDGLLFIHLSFLLLIFNILVNPRWRTNMNYLWVLFLGVSVFCMGYRAVMITTYISLALVTCLKVKSLLQFELINKLSMISTAFMVLLFIIAFDFVTDNAVSGTILFASDEISGEEAGTLAVRLNRSLYYQIPMLLKSPWIGYGFVNVHSQMADDLGYTRLTNYFRSLYYFDFGYGTLLAMFGLIGAVLIIYILIKCVIYCLRDKDNGISAFSLTCAAFILTLLLCNYSFGALEYGIGLLPLSLIIGAAAADDIFVETQDDFEA